MYAIVLLVVVALLSLLVARVAALALTVTGLTRSAARFQARSALTGCGFTTTEAEAVVGHPARRRIIMALMLLGNVGLVTAVAGLLGGYLSVNDTGDVARRSVLLITGLAVVYALSLSKAVDRRLSRVIGRILARFTDLDVRDYASMLRITGEYAVEEMLAQPGDWLVDRPLGELRLKDEGILVLGIVRSDGSYVGAPGKDTCIHAGDTVILYGRDACCKELTARVAGTPGDQAHREATTRRDGEGGGGSGEPRVD